ncbi:MAG: amidase [Gemmatimonadetes bacterium]|nr:amidase [Gemmatimonadota bacterium]
MPSSRSDPALPTRLAELSLSEASRLIRDRVVSPVEVTTACLERIERHQPALNAFITVTADEALERARAAEREIAGGRWLGPLHGIPIALKDLVDVAGVPTTAASRVFAQRVPPVDAEVTRRLREAGAVLLGKLNMHELAFGASSVVSAFGPVLNPWSPAHTSGGSSSGSSVALAAGMCFGALGSDTGGSIRQPAAFANVVGLKPTYGRVSLRGVIPLSTYNDHVGPMTRTVLDAALMLQVLAGYDPEDVTSVDLPVSDYGAALAPPPAGFRLGIARAHYFESADSEVAAALEAAIAVLADVTESRRDVAVPAYLDATVFRGEIWELHKGRVEKTPELLQPDTVRRIHTGADVDAPTYIARRREMDELRRSSPRDFRDIDVLITPTSAAQAFEVAGAPRGFEELRSAELTTLRNTRPFNASGLPALSVPCGFSAAGLPMGMQIVGPPGGESAVLAVAHAYQQRTEWHQRRPPID